MRNGIVWANGFDAEIFVCFPKAYYSYVEREQTEIYAQIRKPSTVVPVPDCLIRTSVLTFLAVITQIVIKVNADFIKNRLVGDTVNGFFGAGVNALATAIAKFFFNFVRHSWLSFTFNSLG